MPERRTGTVLLITLHPQSCTLHKIPSFTPPKNLFAPPPAPTPEQPLLTTDTTFVTTPACLTASTNRQAAW